MNLVRKVGVLTSAHPAFDGRIFLKQCRSLAAAGYEVTLIAPHDRDEIRDRVVIKAVPTPTGRIRRYTSTLWHVYREAVRLRADVYHMHDPELLIVGAVLKLTTSAKIIFDAHEDYATVVLRRAWIPRSIRRFARAVTKGSLRCLLPFVDAIVAATEAIAADLPHPRKIVVKNYCQLAEIPSVLPEADLLVYAGHVSEERGISLFLEAFRQINEVIPVRLRLVGVRDDSLSVEQIIQSCPPGSVEVFGWMAQPEALRLLAGGTLGLVLDLFHPGTDGPPTKLFEYMALGLPVVGCKLPTSEKIIEEAGCGIIVNLREPEKVAASIVELLQDPARLEEMRRRSFAGCKNYQWSSQAELLIDLYRKLETNGDGRATPGEGVCHVKRSHQL